MDEIVKKVNEYLKSEGLEVAQIIPYKKAYVCLLREIGRDEPKDDNCALLVDATGEKYEDIPLFGIMKDLQRNASKGKMY